MANLPNRAISLAEIQAQQSRPRTQLTEISLDMFNMVDEGLSSQASQNRIENKV